MSEFGRAVREAGIDFVCGVPDSLLKGAISQLEEEFGSHGFVVAANEGAAIGLAIGHHLGSSGVPMVFMQNSGLGNAINPIASLADRQVYAIPLVLLIGWRGELSLDGEQKPDEPQHQVQGRVTIKQLELLGIPHAILENKNQISSVFREMVEKATETFGPVAVVVRSGVISSSKVVVQSDSSRFSSREKMIEAIVENTNSSRNDQIPIVATTGMASRELYEIRNKIQVSDDSSSDFLTVGGMGHAISIATSLANSLRNRKVICLDGDGALLMHSGALLLAANQNNLIHVLLDNGVHDSVGGQLTGFRNIDAKKIALGFGYSRYLKVKRVKEVAGAFQKAKSSKKSVFIHVMCSPGHRDNLGRPTNSPSENKKKFMSWLVNLE
jgi:phosphonopyruvate decarboxylase